MSLLKDGKEIDPSEDVVVYVKKSTPQLPGPVELKRHTIHQTHQTFMPRQLIVMVGDTIEFVNEDNMSHSVFSASDPGFELQASAKGKTGENAFMFTGPVLIQCDIHGSMRSDVLVLNNDRYARPDKNGRFRLQDLPAGKYEIEAWEPNGAKKRVEIRGCDTLTKLKEKVQLLKAPKPELRHKDGSPYTIYASP